MLEIETELNKCKNTYKVLKSFYCEDYFYDPIKFYEDLKSLRKDSFENDERIIFVLTSDFYEEPKKDDASIGQFFLLLQKFCNNIDISNCFITIFTTNPFANREYEWIHKNENFDSTKFEIIPCSGVFNRKPFNKNLIFNNFENFDSLIKQLSDQDKNIKDIIQNNESFCVLAWLGINTNPNGDTKMCCDFNDVLGNANQDSLKNIWNSKKFKDIRSSMLSGKKIAGCETCYTKEKFKKDSLRKSSNRKFAKYIKEIVDNTTSDGGNKSFNLKYLDVRYNNLCNLACRSCDPYYSSSWYKAKKYIDSNFSDTQPSPFLVAGHDSKSLYNQVLENIDTIETIYFAGGEPLIIEEFYLILEKLIQLGRTDVELIYNTNLTRLNLKSRYIVDLWKNFSNVSVGASLDAEGRRAEYIRTNTKWDNVEKNRKTLLDECPHIDFYISATTGILNALHVPDFHFSWVEKGLIQPEQFDVKLLFAPEYFSLAQAPIELKEKIREKYENHLEWLMPVDKNGRATSGYKSVLQHMSSDKEFDKKSFWHYTELLDKFHSQNILDYIPELSILPK